MLWYELCGVRYMGDPGYIYLSATRSQVGILLTWIMLVDIWYYCRVCPQWFFFWDVMVKIWWFKTENSLICCKWWQWYGVLSCVLCTSGENRENGMGCWGVGVYPLHSGNSEISEKGENWVECWGVGCVPRVKTANGEQSENGMGCWAIGKNDLQAPPPPPPSLF